VVTMEDMMEYPNLRYLSFASNDIEVLPSNLFKHNPRLERAYFSENPIKVIGIGVFDNLKSLTDIYFTATACLNENYNKQAFQSFKQTFPLVCDITNYQVLEASKFAIKHVDGKVSKLAGALKRKDEEKTKEITDNLMNQLEIERHSLTQCNQDNVDLARRSVKVELQKEQADVLLESCRQKFQTLKKHFEETKYDDIGRAVINFLKSENVQLIEDNLRLRNELHGLTQQNVNYKQSITLNCEFTKWNDNSVVCNVRSLKVLSTNSELRSQNIASAVHEIKIINQVVVALPLKIGKNFPKLSKLTCQSSQLSFLSQDVFEELANLTELDLKKNSIELIKDKVFEGLKELEMLDISDNAITEVQHKAFIRLTKLKILKLNKNRITILPEELFRQTPSLELLEVSENKIKEIPMQIFQNLSNLQVLNVSKNHLEILQKLTLPRRNNIKEIYFNNNKLALIESRILLSMKALQVADFSHNQCINAMFPDQVTLRELRGEISEHCLEGASDEG